MWHQIPEYPNQSKQVKCLSKAQALPYLSLAERLSMLQLGSQHVIALRENFKFKDHPDLKMSTKHLLFQCQEATDEPQMPFLITYGLLYGKVKSPMSNFWCKLIEQGVLSLPKHAGNLSFKTSY